MKKYFFLILLIIGIFGCAGSKEKIRVSSYKKQAIVLPKTMDGRVPKSYSVNVVWKGFSWKENF
jgi:hypothetical protein